MSNDKLAFAVLHLGSNGMEVFADRNEKRRKVFVTWHRKETSDVPPDTWPKMVTGELDFQDSNPMPPGVL